MFKENSQTQKHEFKMIEPFKRIVEIARQKIIETENAKLKSKAEILLANNNFIKERALKGHWIERLSSDEAGTEIDRTNLENNLAEGLKIAIKNEKESDIQTLKAA